jgi:hypothetical protein
MLQKVEITQREQVLSREQKSFNKLLKDNEMLKREIEKAKLEVKQSEQWFNKYIKPIQHEILEVMVAIMVKLDFAIDNFKLSKKQTQILHESIDEYFDILSAFPNALQHKDFADLLKKYSGNISSEETQMIRDQFEEEFGFKMPDDFQFDLTDPDFAKNVGKMIQDQLDEKQTHIPKKTKKQQEAEEAMNKPLRQIYTSLVKILHPDSEQDEALKLKKTDIMKEVTEAYEKADLFKLLSLQMEHGIVGEDKLSTVDASILKVYIKILKEKRDELRFEFTNYLTSKFDSTFLNSEKEAVKRSKSLKVNLENDRKLIDFLSTELGVKDYIKHQ